MPGSAGLAKEPIMAVPAALRRRGVVAVCAILGLSGLAADREAVPFDPLFDSAGAVCGRPAPPLLLAATKTETAPFQPAAMKTPGGEPPLYVDLGRFSWRISRPKAQAYFDQGLRLAFAFNHAEAQRAFQAAQRLDPDCAICFWGEALVLGPNINAPMFPEANAPALAALGRATALKGGASPREQGLIEALERRYSADEKAERAALDAAYADAMQALAQRFADDDTIATLFAEAAMDTQAWDYWEAGGTAPKGRTAALLQALEKVLARSPQHPGAIHLYIHAVEASTTPERALAPARRLAALMPGAGHIVHMPAHIYYRVGQYRDSLEANKRAIAVDEAYFRRSPSDPLYRSAYYPHNIHFVMVSALMGGDGATALVAAEKLDAAVPLQMAQQIAALQPIKAARFMAHARFSPAATVLQLPAPDDSLLLVRTMYHYARAVALAGQGRIAETRAEIAAIARLGDGADYKPFEPFGVPAREIIDTARLVAQGRLAQAQGDLDGAASAFEAAIRIEDGLTYTEPPHWYYPVRQSLAAVRLSQGRLDEAEQAFRDSLARVRNNGWALAGLVEVYRLKGDAKAGQSALQAYAKTWFGPAAGPDLAAL
jgi:tetratricopeptide (TPR) repeat protein